MLDRRSPITIASPVSAYGLLKIVYCCGTAFFRFLSTDPSVSIVRVAVDYDSTVELPDRHQPTMLVTDLHHFLDLPEDAPGPARRLAQHLGNIVRAATAGGAGAPWMTALPCRRRPAHRPDPAVVRPEPAAPIQSPASTTRSTSPSSTEGWWAWIDDAVRALKELSKSQRQLLAMRFADPPPSYAEISASV